MLAWSTEYARLSGFPLLPSAAAKVWQAASSTRRWDSRECPGPISEATLHGTSTRRALTAGALALAVIAPALDPVEHAAEAVIMPPQALPTTPELPDLSLSEAIQERQLRATLAAGVPLRSETYAIPLRAGLEERVTASQRASRSIPRWPAVRAATRQRPAVTPASRRAIKPDDRSTTGSDDRSATRLDNRAAGEHRNRATSKLSERATSKLSDRATSGLSDRATSGLSNGATAELDDRSAVRSRKRSLARVAERPVARSVQRSATRENRAQRRVVVHQKRTSIAKRGSATVRKTTRGTSARHLRAGQGRGMNAVLAFARSQVGKRYVRGGEGPSGFDCSGFTKRAYARAGLRLPHSSGGQARRARTISRANAKPGDLVVGPGHVGIYMGRGMMIDAGNHRTGVVYRKLYRGLRVARIR